MEMLRCCFAAAALRARALDRMLDGGRSEVADARWQHKKQQAIQYIDDM